MLEKKTGAVTIEIESNPDYVETARLATEAFASPGVEFDAEHIRWFYDTSFSQGTIIIALKNEAGHKIGQMALIKHKLSINGKFEMAAQLVDLFIVKAWRSRVLIKMLYDETASQLELHNIRFCVAVPNKNARPVNEHFLSLQVTLKMDMRAGLALPFRSSKVIISEKFDINRRDYFSKFFDGFASDETGAGLYWDGPSLVNRLSGQKNFYAVHATEYLLLISSTRYFKSIPYTLLCGFLHRNGKTPSSVDIKHLTNAACLFWKHPLFVYTGVNAALPHLPGFQIPDRVRPSLMLLQTRDFSPENNKVVFDRFQLIDFDYA
jgi:hypothetical protein